MMTCTGGRVVRPMLMALLRLGSSTTVIVRRPSPAFLVGSTSLALDSNRCSRRAVSTETGSSEAHRVGQGPKRLLEHPGPPVSFSSRQKSFTVFLLVGCLGPSSAEWVKGAARGGGGGQEPMMGGGGGGGGGGQEPVAGGGRGGGGGGGQEPVMGGGGGGGGGGPPESEGDRDDRKGDAFPASTDSTFSVSWSSSSPRSEKSKSPMQSLGTQVGGSWIGSALGLGGDTGFLGSGSRLRWVRSRIRETGLWGVLGAEAGSGESHSSLVPDDPSVSSTVAPASVSARPWARAACFSVSAAATFSRNRAL